MGIVVLFDKGERIMITIFDVANYFIKMSNSKQESSMTPLKLQKLCYYAQAWSLVWDEKPLFNDDFQAWVHGPANYKLYKKYENISRNSFLTIIDENFNLKIFNKNQIETLNVVWDEYGKYDGDYLEQLTHQERPWKETRGNLDAGVGSNRIITKELIKDFYSTLNG